MSQMQMTQEDGTREAGFVEVLTAEVCGEVIGYRFGGSRPGPNALITGDARLIKALFDRLNGLPSLPWMWGRLYLVMLDGVLCKGPQDVAGHLPDVIFDEQVMLAYAPGTDTHDHSVDQGYWNTLRLCSQLGMIAGRGVAMSGPTTQE